MTHAPFLLSPTVLPPAPHGPELFGTFTVEIVTPDGRVSTPLLPDWELRAWGVARLGDATLEARPRRPQLSGTDLDRDLRGAGYLPLGPVRAAHARSGSGPGAKRPG